ncbi:MAG: alpha-2-macroglobulin, partial [Polaribacter sp.]
MKKYTTSLILIILLSLTTNAQNKFDELWTQAEKLEVDGLSKSALEIVEKIYTQATETNTPPQIIKSLFYKSKFVLILEEEAQLKVIENFKSQIAKSSFPTKNVLQNILANLYWQYFNQNRYQFYNRTKTDTSSSSALKNDDFRTWDLDTLFQEIQTYFKASLEEEHQLQEIEIEKFSEILNLQKTTKTFSPTLFDFLANNALTFYKTSENSITKPAYQFQIDSPDFLKDADTFSNISMQSKDSLSLQLNALKIYQKLVCFHITNGTKNALANIDIE